MKKFLRSVTIVEWLIWSISVISIIVFFVVFKNTQYLYLVGSLIGATALIFVSKGNPAGQLLTIVFSVFYGIISYSFSYYGEMITYLPMVICFISFLVTDIYGFIHWSIMSKRQQDDEIKEV